MKQVKENPDLWKCEHPGCGYTGKKGHVKLHEDRAHKQNNNPGNHPGGGSENMAQKNEKDQQNAAGKCPECGGAVYRLLRNSNEIEKRLKDLGFKEICKNCEEDVR